MELSLNSDYVNDRGVAEPFFQPAADAGFTHLFWGHDWVMPITYGPAEMAEFKSWYRKSNLKLSSVHGAAECLKCWWSSTEYLRKAGVELVLNRLQLLDELEGSGPLVMHLPRIDASRYSPEYIESETHAFEQAKKSMDEVMPYLEKYGRQLALENLHGDDCRFLSECLERYPAKLVGLCFDSGHSMIRNNNFQYFLDHADRIYATHLHDNDSWGDWHCAPFLGDDIPGIRYIAYNEPFIRSPMPGKTVDWHLVAEIVKKSPCRQQLTFEVTMETSLHWNRSLTRESQEPESIKKFLAETYTRCYAFAKMVDPEL